MSRPPRDNNDAEIEAFERVCDQLGGFDESISPEWADGYLTSLATAPQTPTMAQWLPALCGDAFERAFADPEDRARAEAALSARMAVLLDQLDAESLDDAPDRLRLSPLMVAWDDAAHSELVAEGHLDAQSSLELVTGAEWADGFFDAIEANPALFAAVPDDEAAKHYEELLQQVHALRLAEGSDELATHLAMTYGAEGADRERLVDEACYAVQDLRLWWVDHAPRPPTRRVEKTPGRNDPCPCGSGKKYKKCHGA